jgi:rRNA maturation RNase YbeY
MITFQTQSIKFELRHKNRLRRWLSRLAAAESKRIGEVSFVFCSDEEVLILNRRYLQHDYFTDVLTFDYSADGLLSGDIVISLDTVRENAQIYRQPFDLELHRVMAHGMLHLCGHRDATAGEQKKMRKLENRYLKLLNGKRPMVNGAE